MPALTTSTGGNLHRTSPAMTNGACTSKQPGPRWLQLRESRAEYSPAGKFSVPRSRDSLLIQCPPITIGGTPLEIALACTMHEAWDFDDQGREYRDVEA